MCFMVVHIVWLCLSWIVLSSGDGLEAQAHGISLMWKKKIDFRDFEQAVVPKKPQLPILEDTMIYRDSLEMCQR